MSTESDDTEMFDHEDEDRDLDSQVIKGQAPKEEEHGQARNERGITPGPQSQIGDEHPSASDSTSSDETNTSEAPKTIVKPVGDTALPEKLSSPGAPKA